MTKLVAATPQETLQTLTSSRGQWGIYLEAHEGSSVEDIMKACPDLKAHLHFSVLLRKEGFLFCDTKEDLEQVFARINPDTVWVLGCDPDPAIGVYLNSEKNEKQEP